MTDKRTGLRTLIFALERLIEAAPDDEQLEKMVIAYLREADSSVWQAACRSIQAKGAGDLTDSEQAVAEAFGFGSQAHKMVHDAGKPVQHAVQHAVNELQEALVAKHNSVDHPKHYNVGKIEVIDAIEDWQLGFHEGNVVKYVARAKHKGNELEDLKKAAWYLNRRIEELSK